MASEFDRIARLRRRFGAPPPPSLGVGDDAAVLASPLPLVVTVDAAVEDVHFSRALLSLRDAAARAIAAAVSDIAAMGARVDLPGCGLVLSWTLPRALTESDFDALVEGSADEADRLGVVIVGGNLSGGDALALHTTVLGRADGPVLTRAGARPGDVLAVTGSPGAASIGFAALREGRDDARTERCVRAWRRPTPRLDEGRAIAGRATACVDVSDGLAQDAAHVASASGVSLVIEVASLPVDETVRALAGSLSIDAEHAALHGGEDYELLATGPASAFDARWTVIGAARAFDGHPVWLRRDGVNTPLPPRGWDHFSDQGRGSSSS
ncbi:MAG: thiamine-phosphate kinase [Polyangiales bacterium]